MMNVLGKDTYCEPWKEIAKNWSLVTPPARPSEEVCHAYATAITNHMHSGQGRALVLGSTPELSDLLQKLKIEVTIVDSNIEMMHAMTSLMKVQAEHEIWLKSDWSKAPLQEAFYDFILGDAVLQNIAQEHQESFLNNVRRMIKPDGLFISRQVVFGLQDKPKSIDIVLKRYAETEPYPFMLFELWIEMEMAIWKNNDQAIDSAVIGRAFEKYRCNRDTFAYPNSEHITHILNQLWKSMKPFEKKWMIYSNKHTRMVFEKQFSIDSELYFNDCYFNENNQCYPLYICTIKK
jgi:hypothetical protein